MADAATAKTQPDARQIKVTQVRSGIGGTRRQRETLKSLGLRRIRQSVVREDNPSVRGMIAKVAHLVTVEEA
ncbi:50S ribosomal protein L30 [Actinomyces sp.]|uniref:50S ribosomal protein L30 n=1 Tax=Actinomyces sp. TaxID=29317 RepID=UPI0026DB343C|nr:50S ribosomal protein L30 [Actinomyces sp.]MDO4900007.1 50S ribosomal protein L30 [Actinomyces sp.]